MEAASAVDAKLGGVAADGEGWMHASRKASGGAEPVRAEDCVEEAGTASGGVGGSL